MIAIESLTKTYHVHQKSPGLVGSVQSLFWRKQISKQALRDVQLKIAQGEMIGLLGANGAGKTTLVKICCGIMRPSAGKVRVLNSDPWQRSHAFLKQISLVMGQKAQLWWDLPAADCFLLLRDIYQIPADIHRKRMLDLAEILNVTSQLNTQIRRLSLGERMKMELIAVLLHQPRVVFLDEPTIGLDFGSQRALREFLLDYHKKFQPTIVVTSHYMEDIEKLCKRIVILRDGAIVYDGSLESLIESYAPQKEIFVRMIQPIEGWTSELSSNRSLSQVSPQLQVSWGEIMERKEDSLKLSIKRDRVSEVAAVLLKTFQVADLNISDPDVGSIVAKIQTGDSFESHS